MPFCEQCGHELDAEHAFCESCGHPSTPPEGPSSVGHEPGPYTATSTVMAPTLAQRSETNGLAVASLVLGILWLGGVGALLALIFGYISKGQIDRSSGRQSGRGMAITGIVLGWVGIVGLVLWIVLLISLNHAVDSALQNTDLTPTTAIGNTGGDTTTSVVQDNISAPAGGTAQTWTISAQAPGGYSETVTVLIGHVEHAKDGATNGSDTAGGACTFDSGTDALVPMVIDMTNTTSNFPASIGYAFTIEAPGATTGNSGDQNVSVSYEGSYSQGEQCSSSDGNISGEKNNVSNDGSSTVDGFLIISNYYSPANPNGNTALLADIDLSVPSTLGAGSVDGSADTTQYTVSGVTGPGVVDENNAWTFNLAGTTPPPSGNSGNSGNS